MKNNCRALLALVSCCSLVACHHPGADSTASAPHPSTKSLTGSKQDAKGKKGDTEATKASHPAPQKTLYLWQPLPAELEVKLSEPAPATPPTEPQLPSYDDGSQDAEEPRLAEPQAALRLLGYRDDAETRVASVAEGHAQRLTVVTECGGDSCSAELWLLDPAQRRLAYLGEELGVVAVDPQLRFFLSDGFEFPDDGSIPDSTRPPFLYKTALGETGAKADKLADCFSPTLLPGATGVLCRNVYGDVLYLDLASPQEHRVVWRAPSRMKQQVVAYAWIYPAPVDFIGEQAHIRVHDAEMETVAVEIPLRDLLSAAEVVWSGPPAPFVLPSKQLSSEEGLDLLRRQLPLFDAKSNTLLLDISEEPCCADDRVLKIGLFAVSAPKGRLDHPLLSWTLSKTSTGGDEQMPSSQRTAEAERLHQHLVGRSYRRLEFLSRSGAPSDWWIQGTTRVLDESGEWQLRGAELRFQPNESSATAAQVTLPPISKHPFCCGLDDDDKSPGAPAPSCSPPPLLQGLWRDVPSSTVVVMSGDNGGPDGCETEPRWQWVRLPPSSKAP